MVEETYSQRSAGNTIVVYSIPAAVGRKSGVVSVLELFKSRTYLFTAIRSA
jgi:hypothetical protein